MPLRDYLNFTSTDDFADFTLLNGQAVAILTMDGTTPLETWYFNGSSMATPNGVDVFKPDAIDISEPGRYIKNMTASDWNTTVNKPLFADVATSGDYNDLSNKLSAGDGILIDTNNELKVDSTKFMSMAEANDVISDMQTDINTKAPKARTITINGITQDLEANRDWEVGNVSTDGSYSNPDWLTSIASSKVTGLSTVATSGSYNDLSNKPSIPNNNNQLTNGAGFLDQTGVRGSFSAGTGINLNTTTGVIANSAPDQTITITAGTGISVSGTYPSFTVTNTTGSVTFNNAPARTLNNNYTISTTKNARVSYTLALTTSLSLLNLNSAARVYLEFSTNGGSSWTTINSAGTSKTLSVSISVGLNETTYWNLVGDIPSNALVRLRSTTSGGGSAVWDSGQEILY